MSRAGRPGFADAAGASGDRLYAHLLGLAIAFALFADQVFSFAIRGIAANWFPLVMVGVYALLTRRRRRTGVGFNAWDVLFLGFTAFFLFAFMFVEFDSWTEYSTDALTFFMAVVLPPYLVFVLTREGIGRSGFDFRILFRYLLAIVAISAFLGLCQSFNLPGARNYSARIWHWQAFEMTTAANFYRGASSPWQGRGPFSHSNGLAAFLATSAALIPMAMRLRRGKLVAGLLTVLVFASCYATYSRGGLLALVACVFAGGVYMTVFRIRQAKAFWAGLAACLILLVSFVAATKANRFASLLSGTQVSGSGDFASIKTRSYAQRQAFATGMQMPLTGIAVTGYEGRESLRSGPARPGVFVIGGYAYAFMMYGIPGLVFILAQPLVLLYAAIRHGREKRHEYGVSCAALATALMFTPISENVVVNYPTVALVSSALVAVLLYPLAKPKRKLGYAPRPARAVPQSVPRRDATHF